MMHLNFGGHQGTSCYAAHSRSPALLRATVAKFDSTSPASTPPRPPCARFHPDRCLARFLPQHSKQAQRMGGEGSSLPPSARTALTTAHPTHPLTTPPPLNPPRP